MADDIRFRETETIIIDDAPPPSLTPATPGDDDAKAAKMKKYRKWGLYGVAGVLAKIAIGFALHYALVGSHYVTTDNAYVDAQTAQINAQVSGQILEVLVADTQTVHRGDVLALIDPADARINLARAEADYQRAVQRVRQYFAQEASSAAQVRTRQAELARAQADYDRRRALAQTGAVSAEEVSVARAAYDAARGNLAAAQENLEAQRALTRGQTVENHPETAAARAAVESARLSLQRTTITAPVDGVVTQLSAQVGQRIEMSQPLMIVAPLRQAYVDANFKEGQLRDVRIGQPVELTSDLYGDSVTYHGRVEGLGGGTGSAFAIIPAQNATGNWIRVVQRVPVRISLDSAELAEHPLRVGLSMEARIDVRERDPETRTASN
ncbi:efflux RND transporter periplasmic adaptor subunit [Terricaulis sp.]|uniref:efflux RND transporter periplasmic adaptor subunit n=1 Tax=Terricaulis sp. TaxID=2768686 RepID=UPI003783A985